MKGKKFIKLIIIFLIIIIFTSSCAFGIYKSLTIGNSKLSFNLLLYTTNTVTQTFTVNAPKLLNGMVPVVWDSTQGKWKVTTSSDLNWYNYVDLNNDGTIASSEKKWANVMMPDTTASNLTSGDYISESDLGSMFVWIPRYEYKITYYTDSTKTTESTTQTVYGNIDVKFIEGTSTTVDAGYTIPPAFRNGSSNSYSNGEWDSELDGIWVAKFENTYSSSGAVQSKPNITYTNEETPYVMYDNAKNATYSLSSDNATLANSHMIKNSEWGAVAYLTYSKYGINGENVYVNNYFYNETTTITGYYAPTYNSNGNSTIVGCFNDLSNMNKYDTDLGKNGSTTGNIYGIFDMVGGRSEYTASYLSGTTGTSNFITQGNTKYCTIYTIPESGTNEEKIKNASKTGDAIGDVYAFNYNAVGGANTGDTFTIANPTLITTSMPCIARGGAVNNGYSGGGIMSFWALDTNTSYYRGYRTILAID